MFPISPSVDYHSDFIKRALFRRGGVGVYGEIPVWLVRLVRRGLASALGTVH